MQGYRVGVIPIPLEILCNVINFSRGKIFDAQSQTRWANLIHIQVKKTPYVGLAKLELCILLFLQPNTRFGDHTGHQIYISNKPLSNYPKFFFSLM